MSEPSNGVMVRLGTTADSDGIATVQVHGWRTAYRGIVPDAVLDRMSVADRAVRWADVLGEPRESKPIWVAASESAEVIGFASAGPGRDDDLPPTTGELWAIYVDPRWAGRGVGRRLLGEATEWLTAANYAHAVLWVLAENARARRFYERAGWRHDGLAKALPFDDVAVDEVRYARAL